MERQIMTKLEKQWILYDVGNSAFTLLVSTIIPIYFKNLAAAGGVTGADSTAYLGYALSLSTVLVAIAGPVLGAVADNRKCKKLFFAGALLLGVIACGALGFPGSYLGFLALFVVARVGFSGSLIFYDSMLVDVTEEDRMDEISAQGYAWGYIGSCIPFIGNLLLVLGAEQIGITQQTAMVLSFLITAVWWFAVTIPLLKNYRQQHYDPSAVSTGELLRRMGRIFTEIRRNRRLRLFLLAFFFYIDGVYTIMDMATAYGKDVGISDTSLLLALLFTQVVAFPCSIAFGKLTQLFETVRLISVCIVAYFLITVFALQLDTAWKFWFLATCVGVFQGAVQALSRSYYARLIPKERASEYFGIYDIFGKGASFLGTMLMGISTQLFHSSKAGVVVIALLFVVGYTIFYLQGRSSGEM